MDIVTALALIVWWGKGDIQDFPYFDKILNVPFSFFGPLSSPIADMTVSRDKSLRDVVHNAPIFAGRRFCQIRETGRGHSVGKLGSSPNKPFIKLL